MVTHPGCSVVGLLHAAVDRLAFVGEAAPQVGVFVPQHVDDLELPRQRPAKPVPGAPPDERPEDGLKWVFWTRKTL